MLSVYFTILISSVGRCRELLINVNDKAALVALTPSPQLPGLPCGRIPTTAAARQTCGVAIACLPRLASPLQPRPPGVGRLVDFFQLPTSAAAAAMLCNQPDIPVMVHAIFYRHSCQSYCYFILTAHRVTKGSLSHATTSPVLLHRGCERVCVS